jgi:Tol biopolymer transport system component
MTIRRVKRVSGIPAAAFLIAVFFSCGGDSAPGPSTAGPLDLIAFGARDGEAYGLYTIRPDSTDLKRISAEDGPISFPRWAPDGTRIAYVVAAQGETSTGMLKVYDLSSSTSSVISDAAATSVEGPAHAWSPDSRLLAFAEGAEASRLRIYDIEAQALAELGDISATALDWSPAEELAIVHAETPGGDPDVFAVRPDGSGLEKLFARQGPEAGVRWSPDGERLAFWTGAPPAGPTGQSLAIVDRDSREIEPLGFGMGPAWSADGRWIAYAGRADDLSADSDILLVPAAGGPPETLNEAGSRDGWPSWSPESGRLVYQALVDEDTAFLCLARLEPPERDCLDLGALIPGAPAWSPS